MIAGILSDPFEGTGGQGPMARFPGRGSYVGAEPCTLSFEWIESKDRAKLITPALKLFEQLSA
jgi:hypothetical protein